MKKEHIEILACKFGRVISIDYHSKLDDRNHSIEEGDDIPHGDLKKALVALHPELAASHYVLGEERENFQPSGFSVTKAGKEETIDQVNISGKIVTAHKDKVTINSGDIPMTEGKVQEKIDTLRDELWEFFWNEKTAVSQKGIPGMQTKKEAAKAEA